MRSRDAREMLYEDFELLEALEEKRMVGVPGETKFEGISPDPVDATRC